MAKQKLSKIEKQKLNPNSGYWKRKALALWSLIVRKDKKCEVCGVADSEKVLNAHHLLPKERYREYMFEPTNGVSVCQMCHKFSKFSAHFNCIWFTVWLMNNRPQKYNWCIEHMEKPNPITSYKDAYEELIRYTLTLPPF